MDLVMLVLVFAVLGFMVWLLTTQIPMPPVWATTIQLFALVVILLYLFSRVVAIPNVLR